MTRPSLAMIADMPFTRARAAMRRYYDPYWGADDEGPERQFRVSIDYSYRAEATHFAVVDATSARQAEAFVRAELKDMGHDDLDVDRVHVMDPDRIVSHPSLFESLQ